MIGYLGADLFSPDRAALELIDEASSDLGSRFFVRIREEMGLAYFVGSSQWSVSREGRSSFISAPIQQNRRSQSRAAGRDPQARRARPSNEEVGAREGEAPRSSRKSAIKQRQLRLHLALDELYGLGARHYRQLRQRVEAVTFEEVRAVARRYFAEQPPVIAVVRPA